MTQNEIKFYSNTNRSKDNCIIIKSIGFQANSARKIISSRNSFFKNKHKTISNNNSKKNSNIIKNLFKNEMISNFGRKSTLANSVHLDANFLRRILSEKKTIKKDYTYKECDIKNNTKFFHNLNIAEQNRYRKTNLTRYKFLYEQKNYNKNFFPQDNFQFSSYNFKKINPFLKKNKKRYNINLDQLRKKFSEQYNINIHSGNNKSKNNSISSFKHININNNRTIYGLNNYTNIIYRQNKPLIIKRVSELLFGNKNDIKNNNNYKNKKLKEDKNYIELNKHKDFLKYLKNNNTKKKEKLIDNIYNEYLKGISSSSESNKSKNEIRNINNKNDISIIKKLKSLKHNLSLNDKYNISQYKKKLCKNNDSSIMIKNNLNNMSKSIILENNI